MFPVKQESGSRNVQCSVNLKCRCWYWNSFISNWKIWNTILLVSLNDDSLSREFCSLWDISSPFQRRPIIAKNAHVGWWLGASFVGLPQLEQPMTGECSCWQHQCFPNTFGRIAKQFRLMDWWCPSVCPSVCLSTFWLTSAFKFVVGHIYQYILDTLHWNSTVQTWYLGEISWIATFPCDPGLHFSCSKSLNILTVYYMKVNLCV